ncbi:MAG: hypothetical protein GX241_02965 [Ruminococcaceae bacterium]|nr:hypothetical protein [Oscillospiraceae bacterium]
MAISKEQFQKLNKKFKSKFSKKSKAKVGKISTAVLSVIIVFLLSFIIVGLCILGYVLSFVNGRIAINLDSYKNSQDQTSIVYATDANGKNFEIARLHGEENRIWVDLGEIPEDVQNAFICLEDKRFYTHPGVDWLRTIKAVLTLGKSGGGSTLTQQLIKNLTEENQASVARKFNEILYALNLEKNYDKSEILEAYLNTIPLGSGCYGVQTAAQKYFGKDVQDLNATEAACIASITKAPTKYNPLLNPDKNKGRREATLWYMYDQGKLSKKEYDAALKYELILTNSEKYVPSEEIQTTIKEEKKIYSYYVEFVIDSVIADLVSQYGYTQNEAWRMVYYGGLKIYTCLDQSIQAKLEDVYVNRKSFPVEKNRTETGENGTKKKAQSAMTIMDYEGRVVAMVGGAGPKTINRGLNRATRAIRSPGSSIKPLSVYAPAIDKGIANYSTPLLNYGIIVGGKRWPQNYGGGRGAEDSYVSLQAAVAQSLNTTSAQLLKKLSLKTSMYYLTDRFHLTTLVESGPNSDQNFSSLAVGGMSHGVNTLEMCAAFATFGNGGKYYAPICYTKVTNFSGDNVVLTRQSNPEQAISEETASIMNKVLQTVVTQGTGRGCGCKGFTTYMKTGTTSDTKDKWAAGGTPYYCGAVWYGYDKQEEIRGIGSSNPAAKIWGTVMSAVHEGYPEKGFSFSKKMVMRDYCKVSGLLAGDSCTSIGTGYFKANKLPKTCTECTGETPAVEAEIPTAVPGY